MRNFSLTDWPRQWRCVRCWCSAQPVTGRWLGHCRPSVRTSASRSSQTCVRGTDERRSTTASRVSAALSSVRTTSPRRYLQTAVTRAQQPALACHVVPESDPSPYFSRLGLGLNDVWLGNKYVVQIFLVSYNVTYKSCLISSILLRCCFSPHAQPQISLVNT